MKQELKPFQHIIDLLIKRDGWIKIPLFTRQEIKNELSRKTVQHYS
jgi:hypothetical protein